MATMAPVASRASSSSALLAPAAERLSRRILRPPLAPHTDLSSSLSSSSPIPPPPVSSHFAAAVQHGVGSLVARAARRTDASENNDNDNVPRKRRNATSLTQISHQAPYRLIPLRSSAVEAAGAAACYIGNYGGGMVPGDSLELNVHVQSHATLGLLTQGSNRVYRPPQWSRHPTTRRNIHDNDPSTTPSTAAVLPPQPTLSSTHLRIDRDGLLVWTPDPVTPFAHSLLEQRLVIDVHPHAAGVCAIDWIGAGRLANGERWEHRHLVNRTTVRWLDGRFHNDNDPTKFEEEPTLAMIDAVRFDANLLRTHGSPSSPSSLPSSLPSSWSCDAVATMILYGPHVMGVVERCRDLQLRLIEPHTRTRLAVDAMETGAPTLTPDALEQREVALKGVSSSRVLLSVSELPPPPHNVPSKPTEEKPSSPSPLPPPPPPLVVVRWATGSNEDLYRLLHYCLLPLSPHLGYQCYQDRIRATQSAPLHHHHHSNHHSSNSLEAPPTRPKYKWASTSDKHVPQPPGIEEDAPTVTITTDTPDDAMLEQPQHGWESAPTLLHASSFWSALMLADSALPVGSFAHSTGLEAAAQLHLWSSSSAPSHDDHHSTAPGSMSSSNNDGATHFLQHYVSAVAQSVMELCTPTIVATHQLHAADLADSNQRTIEWREIDHQLHLRLVSNPPACRASLDQGRSLLRLGDKWDTEHPPSNNRTASPSLLRELQILHRDAESSSRHPVGHLASVFGAVTLGLGLEALPACQLMGYCVARDVVSAAVRLNLVGPMASVAWLAQARAAAQAGIGRGRQSTIFDAHSSCSPLLDLIQPWHDVLATRLFRT